MARKLARLMKKEGVALEEIVEETGLTAQEIVKL
jgi:transcriptional regulator with XRE-family HTH domain